MGITALKRIWITIASLWFIFCVHADEITRNQADLNAIQKEIDSLKKQIQRDEKTLKKERNTLQQTEKDIASINAELAQTQTKIDQARAKQSHIQAEVEQERQRIDEQLSKLGNIVYNQHSMGDNGYLKLLLSQQDPGSIERTMVYYKYLAQYTSGRVVDSRAQVQELVRLESKNAEQQNLLNRLLQDQNSQHTRLKDSQQKRKQAIAALDSQLTQSANRIGRLEEDQRRIQKLVKGLQLAAQKREQARAREAEKAAKEQSKAAAQQTASVDNTTTTIIRPVVQRVSRDGLGSQQGRLNMPVSGTVLASYGSLKQDSGVKWNGLMLAVNEGQPVSSIYDGQVVYADWFKGFGQLVIIDHGKGYMSLYSHNSRITRSVGEQIKQNDVIAYSGSTGGLNQPGLYFEVRYNGEPRDPLLWVKR